MRHSLRRTLAALVFGLVFAGAACAGAAHLAQDDLPSLDVMIGQMLVIGFEGTRPDASGVRHAIEDLKEGRIGGVILMDRNIRSPDQVRDLTATFARASPDWPAFIAIDQEGGSVQRLASAKGFRRYPTARRLARRHGPLSAYFVYRRLAKDVAKAGFNLNFGPVVDLNLNTYNRVINIRGRSYDSDPTRVAAYAQAFIAAHRHADVLTSVKHFPGHGSSRRDSHLRFVDLSKSWKEVELDPYRTLAGLEAIDTIMVGHLYHPNFSNDRQPATLAPAAINWIREDLGFDGVIITDDLDMAAVRKGNSPDEVLIRAVAAGNDVLLLANQPSRPGFAAHAVALIREAVESGRISADQIAGSYQRIMDLKARLRAPAPLPAGQAVRTD